MGCIVAAEVYKEGTSASVGLLIPYKAIQFDNPIVTQVTDMEDQTITVNIYDAFVGTIYPWYKVLLTKTEKIKQVVLNDSIELEVASFVVVQESAGSNAFKKVDVRNITTPDELISYIVSGINIPDEIEEVLHFGGKGWLLKKL